MPRFIAETGANWPNQIRADINCKLCNEEGRAQWQRTGLTAEGIQVWCVYHDCNIGHFKIDVEVQSLFFQPQLHSIN